MTSEPASSSKDSGDVTTDAAGGESLTWDYIVYPHDGHTIDAALALLATYPPSAKIIPHVSVSGWGMMYWEATLSPAQAREVSSNKDVLSFLGHVFNYI